jgi:molybdenum cofactor biosynthesis enzyme MoaA
MKKLEQIGFYTLSDERARTASVLSPLSRCEMILTDKCNFSCPYCRGLRADCAGDLPLSEAIGTINLWIKDKLKNIRFSGGEPSLYPYLNHLVKMCKLGNMEHIAVSTNGYADFSLYEKLLNNGVNDFSISLDACCSAVGDRMSGGVTGAWEQVVNTIRRLSELTYVSVGMVFTEENVSTCKESVLFADSLGVSDIRIIPSAQYNRSLIELAKLPSDILEKYPILRYRVENIRNVNKVRGLRDNDCKSCWLALDDMAVAGRWHFPCIIYLREGGEPIGKIGANMREERFRWILNHDSFADEICSHNCLDVCAQYNNVAALTHSSDNMFFYK